MIEDFERRERVEVSDDGERMPSRFDSSGHLVSDMLCAMCMVSRTDIVAHVPRLLAVQFLPALGLEIVRLPSGGSPTVALSMWSRGSSVQSADPAVTAVAESLVEAGAQLGRRTRR
jgi:hypothetical protein